MLQNQDPLFNVSGKNVLITGSTRGIGHMLAVEFSKRGANVIVNGRNQKAAEEEAENIHKISTGVVHAAAFDVTDSKSVDKALQRVDKELGPVEILINNAGGHIRAPIAEMSEAQWNDVINMNLTGAFIMARAVYTHMQRIGKGRIINISSLNSIGARPTIANYCSAKAGLNAFTRSLATEWGHQGILSNAIAPGYILTDLTKVLANDPDFDDWVKSEVPLGRWGKPEELVGCAIFLASEASAYVNGQLFVVDGGWTACL
jgi:gluconate 5-dehydrogenase